MEENKNTNEPINRFLNFSTKAEPYIADDPRTYEKTSGNLLGNNVERARKITHYTKEEAERIIESGDPTELRELSNFFFYSSGFYKKLLVYYATILYYTPLIIPHMIGNSEKITKDKYKKKYFTVQELVNSLNFEQLCRRFAIKTLIDGAYYGMIVEYKGNYNIQDLPYKYCRTRFKNIKGMDLIELDLTWFDKMSDKELRSKALDSFPKNIKKAYNEFKKNGKKRWAFIPDNLGIHFELYEERPFFAAVIPSIINFNDYINIERDRDEQELRSIIAQEIEHIADGSLVLDPQEAEELHNGLKKIAQGNKNVDAITTYGKIKVHQVHESDATIKNNLEKIEKAYYSEAGVSKQLFSADTNTALEKSIQNDICMMMMFANSVSIWLKNFINSIHGDKKIRFDAEILPVGQYNQKEYLSQTLNAAQYGYSFIIPSLVMGLEESQLLDLKRVEIDVLDMQTLLVPLRSSHTESGNQGDKAKTEQLTEQEQKEKMSEGASVEESEQTEKTIKNKNAGGDAK